MTDQEYADALRGLRYTLMDGDAIDETEWNAIERAIELLERMESDSRCSICGEPRPCGGGDG